MLKKIDIYIIKKFLGTFFFSIMLIISIAIVFDFSENLDNIIEKQVSAKEVIFDYYLNFIPYYVNLFLFLFVFISVIFFTSKMAAKSEIIAILSTGISFRRFLYPYFVSAFVLAILSLLLSNFIIPPANKVRIKFEGDYLRNRRYNNERNMHKQISPGVYLYIEFYAINTDIAHKFSIEKYENKQLVSKLVSTSARWDTSKNKWTVSNYYIRDYGEKEDILKYGKTIDTAINIYPEDFKRTLTEITTLDYFELNDFIAEQRLYGTKNIDSFLLEKYRRIAFPFSTFILSFIGVALASRKVKGGTGLNIGIGLLISFMYILFMQISDQFTIKGSFPPLLSVWTPNIIFTIVAYFVYRLAPK